MYFSGGWATATPNLGYDVSFNPIVGVNLNIPIFRWGARFKTNRQQKAYIGIQKLQQSYMTDNINEETVGSSHQTDGNRISGENSERKHESGK